MITALLLMALTADWGTRVTAAKAANDNEAMIELLREALYPREIRLSGTSDTEHVHPDDNEPAPVVNFDPDLQNKQSARPRNGGPTRSLAKNAGYYFSVRGVPYVVVGPAGLDPRSPAFTRLITEHEMFHAENHVGDPRPLHDRELETWSAMFVRYFDEIHPFRQRWAPMLHYYDKAGPAEQEAAVHRLVEYYEGASPAAQSAFREWLTRRTKDKSALIEALGARVSSPAPAGD